MVFIDEEKCIQCGACVKDCPAANLQMQEDGRIRFFQEKRCLNCGHCIAVCPRRAVSIPEFGNSQVIEYSPETCNIEPNRFLGFLRMRRSVRHFKKQKVDPDILNALLEAGRYAPTSGNRQHVSYLVVQDHLLDLRDSAWETLENLAIHAFNGEPAVEAVKYYAATWHQGYLRYKKDSSDDILFFDAPVLLVVRSDTFVDASIAADHIQLMAQTMRLGCTMNGFLSLIMDYNQEIRELFCTKRYNKVVCMMLGYPSVKYYRTVPRNKVDAEWI